MDKKTVVLINTFTNSFALAPIIGLYKNGYYKGSILVLSAALSSCLMHLSETKHNLGGPYFNQYSNLFLNIDRGFAILTFIYGIYLLSSKTTINIYNFLVPAIGLLSSFLGEQTPNLYKYTVLHSIWHFCAYIGIYLLI